MRAFLPLALVAALLISGCAQRMGPAATAGSDAAVAPIALLDPLLEGSLAFESADYDAGVVTVGGPDANHSDYEYDARVRGRAWWPTEPGAYPVLVLLHGQHAPCATLGRDFLVSVDPCDDDEGINTPYPNHLGYEYLATHLASHGYIVLSALAYEINSKNGGDEVGMWARGELVLATLDAVRDGSPGMPPTLLERADLGRTGLMGHSRGGEGVVSASHVNEARSEAERHALMGIVALAPTDFNERGVKDVALLSLLPYCDGDVSTLHGLRTFDHSRWLDNETPKLQVLVRGTNHNHYNSRWYQETGLPLRPGSDGSVDPTSACGRERDLGGWRWTPEETQRESLVHVAGFLRWTVGGEAGLAPWFTGGAALPEGACPAGELPCDGAVAVSAILPGARPLAVVEREIPPQLHLDGFADAVTCRGADCAPSVLSSAWALRVEWSDDAAATLAFDAPQDWTAHDVLSFRAAALASEGPLLTDYGVTVEVVDAAGTSAAIDARAVSTAFEPTPDTRVETALGPVGSSKVALQSVRIPLRDIAIDLSSVQEVRVRFTGEGRALLTDFLVQAEPDVTS